MQVAFGSFDDSQISPNPPGLTLNILVQMFLLLQVPLKIAGM